jgi:predicted methyltransferase
MNSIQLHHGDCLKLLPAIPDKSVDLVLCDLPYGTTACTWDSLLPLGELWAQYRRVCKPSAPMVFTAVQPFTSTLIVSNLREFRHEWIWEKSVATGFLDANRRPMRCHESVLVFAQTSPTYYPQKTIGAVNHACNTGGRSKSEIHHGEYARVDVNTTGLKFPRSVLRIPSVSRSERTHPTQKPVELMEYLVRTYSCEGGTVLDNTMGSGSTGVAAVSCGRSFIGMEADQVHFETAKTRILRLEALL